MATTTTTRAEEQEGTIVRQARQHHTMLNTDTTSGYAQHRIHNKQIERSQRHGMALHIKIIIKFISHFTILDCHIYMNG